MREALLMARGYVQGAYPEFVYSGRTDASPLPVFYYHNIERREFEQQLAFLNDNGYAALVGDEAADALAGPRSNRSREVMLTFDDGLASLFTDVYPALHERRMRAVAYIVPAYVGRPGFVTWDQCRQMRESGAVDLQSHSHRHSMVVTGLTLRGIWLRRSAHQVPWQVPGLPEPEHSTARCLPVLEGRSLFEATEAFELPESFWKACADIETRFDLRGEIGPDRPTLVRLGRAYRRLVRERQEHANLLKSDDLLPRVMTDLMTSRTQIESALPGHRVRHFGFPWHASGSIAWEALQQSGFVTGAVGLAVPDVAPASGNGGPRVVRIARTSGDFIYCLPGRGRRSFYRVVGHKMMRRVRGPMESPDALV